MARTLARCSRSSSSSTCSAWSSERPAASPCSPCKGYVTPTAPSWSLGSGILIELHTCKWRPNIHGVSTLQAISAWHRLKAFMEKICFHLGLRLPFQVWIKVEIVLEPFPILQNGKVRLNTHLLFIHKKTNHPLPPLQHFSPRPSYGCQSRIPCGPEETRLGLLPARLTPGCCPAGRSHEVPAKVRARVNKVASKDSNQVTFP